MAWLLGLSDERIVIRTRWPSREPPDSETVRALLTRKWPNQFVLSPLEASATGRHGKCIIVTFALSADDEGRQTYGDKYEWMVCGGTVHPLSR